MKEVEKNGCSEQEKKLQKAFSDVKSILDRHYKQGELEQETHNKILDEMERIFHNGMEGEENNTIETNKET